LFAFQVSTCPVEKARWAALRIPIFSRGLWTLLLLLLLHSTPSSKVWTCRRGSQLASNQDPFLFLAVSLIESRLCNPNGSGSLA